MDIILLPIRELLLSNSLSIIIVVVVITLLSLDGKAIFEKFVSSSDRKNEFFKSTRVGNETGGPTEAETPELPNDPQSTQQVELKPRQHTANINVIPEQPTQPLELNEYTLSQEAESSHRSINLQTLENSKMEILGDNTEGIKQPKAICTTNEDCNIIFGDGKNICSIEGVCICNRTKSNCHVGPTNYKDPKSMNSEQLLRFKNRYRTDFTIQDYKNWLGIYKNDGDTENLTPEHRKNYDKLIKGIEIKINDLPNKNSYRRITAADRFMAINRDRFSLIPFPLVNGVSNLDEGDNGSVFQNPRKIGEKMINLDELVPKRSAYKVRQYLGPSLSESADPRNFKFIK